MKNDIKPLFIWAGGKNKMMKYYEDLLPSRYSTYCEPFFGGGAMFIYLKKNNPLLECYINDINADIMQIYKSIQKDMDSFLKIVDDLQSQYLTTEKKSPQRKKFYLKIRKKYAYEHEKWNKVTESSYLYFLMRTGFNGIWQS